MICRKSRDQLALALRRYVTGRISNDDLDDIEVDGRDRGAVAVKNASWHLYSDMKRHYATGKHAITDESRRSVARWVVFLHSDQEYPWPEFSFDQFMDWLLNLVTFGWWARRKTKEGGEFAAWPFARMIDSDAAARRLRYFAGRRSG